MALPIDGRTINNIIAMTLDAKLPRITDNFFLTNALFQKLYQRAGKGESTVRFDGGAEIRSTIIYQKMPSYSYARGQQFGTEQQEFATDLQLQWKRAAAEINADSLDIQKNAGSEVQLFNYVEVMAKNAFNSLSDELGYEIFSTRPDTSNVAVIATPASTDFDGLYNGVSATGTYGGITRTGNPGTPGFAIESPVVNAGAAPLSLAIMQSTFGKATYMPAMPDLIVTTQNLWNDLWARVQPQDRNAPGPLRDVGFDTIRFNRAEVIVDAHCPAGYMYFLNTEFIELWLMEGKDFVRRAASEGYSEKGFPIPNQDAFVDQLIVYGNLVIPGPRYQALLYNLTE